MPVRHDVTYDEWHGALLARLAQAPAGSPAQLRSLSLRGLGIRWGVYCDRDAELFAPFTGLEEVDLSDNDIDVVWLPFDKLPRLRKLDLSRNDLGYWAATDQCPLDRLGGPSLRELSVADNAMGHVRLTAAAPFAAGLRALDVSSNAFPAGYEAVRGSLRPLLRLCPLERLEALRARGNLIREVPKLGRFPALRELDLGENPLQCNFQHLLALPQLEALTLDRVGLRRVPAALFELKRLRRLDLSGNELPAPELRRLREALRGVELRPEG
ncbi:MAG TPA: hypothetical protein VFS00_18035 [Polyangiaceae bacterium]|nr:hypothetical protein [Polyangiaceae bacterium]